MTILFTNQGRMLWLYALIISVLGFYSLFLRKGKQAQFAQYYNLVKMAETMDNILEGRQESLLSGLRKSAQNTGIEENKALRNQGIFIQKSMETMEQFIHNEVVTAALKGISIKGNYMPFLKGILGPAEQMRAYSQQNQTFTDSLYLFAKGNPHTLAGLDSIFSQSHHLHTQRILNKNRDDQKVAILTALRIRQSAAACQTLDYLKENLQSGILSRFDAVIPAISYKDQCIRAGETFTGEVYPAPYYYTHNLTASINNLPIPMRQGLGKFQQQYHTPGLKKVAVNIFVRNPLTREVNPYTKQFNLQICE